MRKDEVDEVKEDFERGFYVYDPDPKVEERFQELLGSGIEQRFHSQRLKSEDAIQKETKGYK